MAECQHCYCKKTVIEGKTHMQCCMCGHRYIDKQTRGTVRDLLRTEE